MVDMSWFPVRARHNFERHVQPMFAGKPTAYLEIGVWSGQSLGWMLENVLTHPGSRAIGVDAWWPCWTRHRQWTAEQMEECYGEALRRVQPYRPRVTLVRAMSGVWLRTCGISKHTFDMVYLDGEHTSVGLMDDLALSWPLLKPGGLLLFDDYFLRKRKWHAVKTVVDAVMPAVYGPYVKQLFVDDHQIGFVKTGDARLTICDGEPAEENQLIGVSTT